MSEIRRQVSELIKQARTEKNVTLKELGRRLAITESAAAKYEAGDRNISVEILEEIANALGVHISE